MRVRRLLQWRLLYHGRADERHVLAQPDLFPLEQNANGGAIRPSKSALHLLTRRELHADEVNFENCVADTDKPAFRCSSRRLQAGDLVKAVVAAHELHADAASGAFERGFHQARCSNNDLVV
jgi:hypothetical protein